MNIIDKIKKTVTSIASPSRQVKEEKITKKAARRSPGPTGAKSAVARRSSRIAR